MAVFPAIDHPIFPLFQKTKTFLLLQKDFAIPK
jgi:hypothetical protein